MNKINEIMCCFVRCMFGCGFITLQAYKLQIATNMDESLAQNAAARIKYANLLINLNSRRSP